MAKSKGRVLVIDDALEMASALVEYLRRHGFEAQAFDSGQEGIASFRAAPTDAVLTDLRMKGTDGMDVLRAVRELDPDVPVVIMTAFGAVESAVEAIQRGAYHYVTKPFKLDVVRVLLERAIEERSVRAENVALRRAVREAIPGGSLVGRSPGIRAVNELIRRVAATSTPVLILGETGTGKELVARDIHADGPRRANARHGRRGGAGMASCSAGLELKIFGGAGRRDVGCGHYRRWRDISVDPQFCPRTEGDRAGSGDRPRQPLVQLAVGASSRRPAAARHGVHLHRSRTATDRGHAP